LTRLGGLRRAPVEYLRSVPSPQGTLDLFKGDWISAFPHPLDGCQAGTVPLFADPKVAWAISRWGGVEGLRVLELGPLEGMHTYLLEQNGAASITAIEGNPKAFLRCLVSKELLGLKRASFLYGDFVEFLRQSEERFDVVLASGVLYHMEDPVELLGRLGTVCSRLYLWTHFFDGESVRTRANVSARFDGPIERATRGLTYTAYKFRYATDKLRGAFCGGPEPFAYWLTQDDIIRALRHFGFTEIEQSFVDRDHVHGPAFALVAQKPAERRPVNV
jgi:Methyltransferase domain